MLEKQQRGSKQPRRRQTRQKRHASFVKSKQLRPKPSDSLVAARVRQQQQQQQQAEQHPMGAHHRRSWTFSMRMAFRSTMDSSRVAETNCI